MANVTVYVNHSASDNPLGTTGVNWIEWGTTGDILLFSNGSDIVADGEPIPSATDIMRAGIILNGTEQVVPKYFLADASANILRDITLMGNTTSRHVIAFDFDGATASEPVLEVWDDENLNTINGTILGTGVSANSWFRGITTTTNTPTTNWTGTVLAGSASNRILYLNDQNGPLSAATTLYCNIKLIVPATATVATNAQPKIAIKFASN